MRRFMVHLVTEVDFVDGDEASDEAAQNYQKHLSDTLRNAAQGISLRTIKDARVESVSVARSSALWCRPAICSTSTAPISRYSSRRRCTSISAGASC